MNTSDIKFNADRVKIKSGHRVDNSGEVIFMVGEYQLENIKNLVNIIDKNLEVTVKVLE
jgi:hypothetical protein